MRTAALRALAACTILSLSGCDALTGSKEGSFILSLSDQALTLGQSGRDTIVITVVRTDFVKPVILDVDGAPTGVTAVFSPKIVQSGLESSELRLTVSGTAAPGSATLTITGTGEGLEPRTATVDLTIGVTGSFTLSTHGAPATAAQGGGAQVTVLVQRIDGHADNVSLSVSGEPAGVTATLSQAQTTGSNAAITLAAAAGTTPGSYPITVSGTAPGLAGTQTTDFTLNVIPPPATAPLTYPFPVNGGPVWLAYQNEGYLWQTATGVAGSYTFNATDKLAIAYAYDEAPFFYQVWVEYATRSEFANATTRTYDGAKAASASVAGLVAGTSALIRIGGAGARIDFGTTSFSFTNIPDKVVDLFAAKGALTQNMFGEVFFTPDTWILRRNQNPPASSAIPVFDFNGGEAMAPAQSNLTIGNTLANDEFKVEIWLRTPIGTDAFMTGSLSTGTTRIIRSIPGVQLAPGDVHEVQVEARQPNFASGRIAVQYLGALTDRTETMPPPLSVPTITPIVSAPFPRLNASIPVQPEYQSIGHLTAYAEPPTGPLRFFEVYVTKGFLGATPPTAWSLTMPDLTTAPGFNTVWLPSPIAAYQVDAFDGPLPLLYGAMPVIGDSYRTAYRVAEMGPPGLPLHNLRAADKHRLPSPRRGRAMSPLTTGRR